MKTSVPRSQNSTALICRTCFLLSFLLLLARRAHADPPMGPGPESLLFLGLCAGSYACMGATLFLALGYGRKSVGKRFRRMLGVTAALCLLTLLVWYGIFTSGNSAGHGFWSFIGQRRRRVFSVPLTAFPVLAGLYALWYWRRKGPEALPTDSNR